MVKEIDTLIGELTPTSNASETAKKQVGGEDKNFLMENYCDSKNINNLLRDEAKGVKIVREFLRGIKSDYCSDIPENVYTEDDKNIPKGQSLVYLEQAQIFCIMKTFLFLFFPSQLDQNSLL